MFQQHIHPSQTKWFNLSDRNHVAFSKGWRLLKKFGSHLSAILLSSWRIPGSEMVCGGSNSGRRSPREVARLPRARAFAFRGCAAMPLGDQCLRPERTGPGWLSGFLEGAGRGFFFWGDAQEETGNHQAAKRLFLRMSSGWDLHLAGPTRNRARVDLDQGRHSFRPNT